MRSFDTIHTGDGLYGTFHICQVFQSEEADRCPSVSVCGTVGMSGSNETDATVAVSMADGIIVGQLESGEIIGLSASLAVDPLIGNDIGGFFPNQDGVKSTPEEHVQTKNQEGQSEQTEKRGAGSLISIYYPISGKGGDKGTDKAAKNIVY